MRIADILREAGRPRFQTLRGGTILYHGTSDPDWDEQRILPKVPLWLSNSPQVAQNFSTWHQWEGGRPRVITYRLNQSIRLVRIDSAGEFEALKERLGYFEDTNALALGVVAAGYAGWIIPRNYPEGADIMIGVEGVLERFR
jgi:hypothetical protein